jgi:hypothetical protein
MKGLNHNIEKRFMKLVFSFCIILTSILIGCSKENVKSCWQAFSQSGFDVIGLTICEVTKAEAEQRYPNYWFYKAGNKILLESHQNRRPQLSTIFVGCAAVNEIKP